MANFFALSSKTEAARKAVEEGIASIRLGGEVGQLAPFEKAWPSGDSAALKKNVQGGIYRLKDGTWAWSDVDRAVIVREGAPRVRLQGVSAPKEKTQDYMDENVEWIWPGTLSTEEKAGAFASTVKMGDSVVKLIPVMEGASFVGLIVRAGGKDSAARDIATVLMELAVYGQPWAGGARPSRLFSGGGMPSPTEAYGGSIRADLLLGQGIFSPMSRACSPVSQCGQMEEEQSNQCALLTSGGTRSSTIVPATRTVVSESELDCTLIRMSVHPSAKHYLSSECFEFY